MGAEPKIVLYGGEKDGWEDDIDPADRPDVYYMIPYADEGKLSCIKSNRERLELRDKLATLAYRYDPARSSANRFRMYRAPELDRVPQR